LPPQQELRAAWGRDTQVWRGSSSVPLLLTLDDVEGILADGRARHPQIAVLSHGVPAASSDYTTSRSINGAAAGGFINPAADHTPHPALTGRAAAT
jgi:hypothetical protein